MLRVRDLTSHHAVVAYCEPCERGTVIRPVPTDHLADKDAPVLSLAYRCTYCRRRSRLVRLTLRGRCVEERDDRPTRKPIRVSDAKAERAAKKRKDWVHRCFDLAVKDDL